MGNQAKGRIVVVDDTTFNVELLHDILVATGYTVYGYDKPVEAYDALEELQPDLILLDIMMPVLPGFEFCEKLKANPNIAHIPVIFISALSDSGTIVKGFDLGGADYIMKPFERREVLARVKHQITMVQQRRDLDRQHQQQVQSFETLNVMKEQFIRSATHDLKNPLHMIVGYAGLLEDIAPEEFTTLGPQLIRGIQDGAEKMQALIEEMLDLAKLETRTTPLNFQNVTLGYILEHTVKMFEMMAQQKNITLTLAVEPPNIDLYVDVNRLSRAFENLVSNAIKYTPDGGNVHIESTHGDKEVYIAVSDNGYGIPEDALPQLFQPFFRVNTKQHRAQDGTGLGLSMVKSIIEQHNGTISVESESGAGTIFKVCLPIA